ncbi:hypothetical protein FG147_02470 [Thauera sp. UPWRP]|nr:hypothetical protein FG147_02470 [Thauera sp. UPWRP]
MIWFLFGVEVAAACVVVWHAVARLNRMSRCTRLEVVLSWMAIGAAAMGVIGDAVSGELVLDWQGALLMLAVAGLAGADLRGRGHPRSAR